MLHRTWPEGSAEKDCCSDPSEARAWLRKASDCLRRVSRCCCWAMQLKVGLLDLFQTTGNVRRMLH